MKNCMLTLLLATSLAMNALAQQGDVTAPPASVRAEPEQVLTGKDLMERCSDQGGPQSAGGKFCMTFMVGLVQTVSQMQLSGEGPMLFCVDPNQVTPEAVRDSAVAWMQKRPERAGDPAYVLVSEALREAYPCPTVGGPVPAPAAAPM